jgi:uroporphyrinogen decarboxylase
MKHRDRIITALNHEEADRCPMSIAFTPEFAARLREALGLKDTSRYNPHGAGNTYDLEVALGIDMLQTSVGWVNWYNLEGEEYSTEWGMGFKRIEYMTKFGPGSYTENCVHPLAEADDRAVEAYRAPDPNAPGLYDEAARLIQNYKDEYWVVGVTVTTIFETAEALRGPEQLLMDFAVNPELADRILEIPYQHHLAAAKKLVRMGVDMIWVGDDVGAQSSMLISPAQWRKFLKPRMANFISEIKAINPALKVAYHSDGMIYPIIPELIEIGVDVLNPIQPACMDPAQLKREFGDRVCFWGSLDEQYTLPFGTPAEVREEVLLRLKTIGKGGGFIIGPTHNVQLDTPMENFWAMVDTIKNTSYSSLKTRAV